MKKIVYLIATALVLMTVSCKKEQTPLYQEPEKLTLVSYELEYFPEASEGKVVVNTTDALTATSNRDWCVASVAGNTVSIRVTDNTSKQNRYARLALKAGDASLDVTVIQYGEVLAGLGTLTDITSPVEGNVITIPVKLNVSVTFDTDADWIHPELEENQIVVKVDPNPNPETRLATVSYTAGSAEGSFDVTQYPELKKNADWVITEGELTFKYPEFSTTASMNGSAEDLYVLCLVPKDAVEGTVDSWIFDKLAVQTRNEILESVEANPGTTFSDYLVSGSEVQKFTNLNVGENYFIALGFGENTYVTGLYQYKLITLEDIRPTYYKWAGKWKLSGKNIQGNAYEEVFEILVNEADVDEHGDLKEASLIVHGMCTANQAGAGVDPSTNIGDMYVTFDKSTGSITFYGQNGTQTFTHSSQGSGCKLQLISMYVKAGSTSYTNVTGGKFIELTMGEDGKATNLTILDRSAGLPYRAFRMRLLNSAGSAYTIGGDAATIAIDNNLTITRTL